VSVVQEGLQRAVETHFKTHSRSWLGAGDVKLGSSTNGFVDPVAPLARSDATRSPSEAAYRASTDAPAQHEVSSHHSSKGETTGTERAPSSHRAETSGGQAGGSLCDEKHASGSVGGSSGKGKRGERKGSVESPPEEWKPGHRCEAFYHGAENIDPAELSCVILS
jgi:hypothetical protein